jgi:hypothetical protein
MNRYQVVRQEDQDKWRIWDAQTKQYLGWSYTNEHDAKAKILEIESANKKKRASDNMKKKMNLESIMEVIGTPEENRKVLVKSLLLDLNMKCKNCGLVYRTAKDLERMEITRFDDATNPAAMCAGLECWCGHAGEYIFKPNPFIKNRS